MVPGRWASHQHGAVQIQRKLTPILLNSALLGLIQAFWPYKKGALWAVSSVLAVWRSAAAWSSQPRYPWHNCGLCLVKLAQAFQ